MINHGGKTKIGLSPIYWKVRESDVRLVYSQRALKLADAGL